MTTTSPIQNQSAYSHYDFPVAAGKAQSVASKSVAGALGEDNSMGAWMEQASAWFTWYNGVMNGTVQLQPGETPPTSQDYAQMQEYWTYATGSSWGEGVGSYGSGVPAAPQSVPPGSMAGAAGNVVFDHVDATITHIADSRPIDIYSNNIVINSGSMMTTFTSQITTDTRLEPPEQVLTITASDGTTYFIHDYEDAAISVKTPIENMVTDNSGTGLVLWEEYGKAPDAVEEVKPSYAGGEVEQDGNTYTHTSLVGETIDFFPQPNAEGALETHDVYGDANICLRSDYSANITYDDSDANDHVREIHVFDHDGNEVAVYRMHEGFELNLNMNENYLTISNDETPIADYNPSNSSQFWDEFTINGEKAREFTVEGEEETDDDKGDKDKD